MFCEEYTTRHINELRQTRNATINRYKEELQKFAVEKEKLIDAIKRGVPASEIIEPHNKIVERRTELEKYLESNVEAPVLLHPNMSQRYQQGVAVLKEALMSCSLNVSIEPPYIICL